MAKTAFVDGNPQQGIQGTIVSAAFLNKLNSQRHTGRDIDGEGANDYAADTGEENQYEIELTPELDAHIIGMPIRFKAANTCTGASTLKVNVLDPVALKKNVNQDLESSDIIAGQIVCAVYDGTYYQLINVNVNVNVSIAIRDTYRNLKVVSNATYPNYKEDLTADEAILQNSNGIPMRLSAISLIFDITTNLDTGSEASSIWYHRWIIAKEDGTIGRLYSLSYTNPTMPSGYTYKAYAGPVYNDASSNFRKSLMYKNRVSFDNSLTALSDGTATVYTAISLASIIPVNAIRIMGSAGLGNTDGSTRIAIAAGASGEHKIWLAFGSAGGGIIEDQRSIAYYEIPIRTAQTMYYKTDGAAHDIYIQEFEF